jgi:hypothetical protein
MHLEPRASEIGPVPQSRWRPIAEIGSEGTEADAACLSKNSGLKWSLGYSFQLWEGR